MTLYDQPDAVRRPSRRFPWLGLILAAGVAGCGNNDAPKKVQVYPVKGQVLLPDGKPLKAGRVVFVSKDGLSSSTGKLSEDGTFTLTTGESGEGAPAGDYKVRIEPDEATLPKSTSPRPNPRGSLPFPGKYTDEDASELTATVKPEPNQLEPFKMSNAAPKAVGRAAVRD
jgi:hypothetical protein